MIAFTDRGARTTRALRVHCNQHLACIMRALGVHSARVKRALDKHLFTCAPIRRALRAHKAFTNKPFFTCAPIRRAPRAHKAFTIFVRARTRRAQRAHYAPTETAKRQIQFAPKRAHSARTARALGAHSA